MAQDVNLEDQEQVPFQVDAALLRELGERLVGRPHIALAEMIKNAYDADATVVELDIGDEEIVVSDDGHGMTGQELRERWMRIGSPHKEREVRSRRFERPLTGAKGIGRLAAQFLGSDLQLWTQADTTHPRQLYARVDWHEARKKKLVTEAKALVGRIPRAERIGFPDGATHGTSIHVGDLRERLEDRDVIDLAREVWALQPPFAASEGGFEIRLNAPNQEAIREFDDQVAAYLDVWYARVKGRLEGDADGSRGMLRAELRFADGETHKIEQEISPCRVTHADIEIRMYYLRHRQPKGLSVSALRDYFNKWGGVHIYDSGFRLPYYGPDVDWLGIEMDYAHRISTSRLLPDSEKVRNGMRFLPSNGRIFGEVRVSTSAERRAGTSKESPRDILQIQASRDRLVDNRAFGDLHDAVRFLLDWYANREAARQARQRERDAPVEPVATATEQLEETVTTLEPKLDSQDYSALSQVVAQVRAAERSETAEHERQTRLMGTLASAGAASLAYEHEIGKQMHQLQSIGQRLTELAKGDPKLEELADELQGWLERARRARGLFAPLIDQEGREQARALPARQAIDQIVEDLDFVLANVPVEIEVAKGLRLPRARLAEWNAIFQNAFTNAIAAMRGVDDDPRIRVRSGRAGRNRYLIIEDRGAGIDLDQADRFFEPFERGDVDQVGPGTGLGLAILRMLAEAIGVRAAFVKPEQGWNTALRLSWRKVADDDG
jgi:signal transduction histidine kinase